MLLLPYLVFVELPALVARGLHRGARFLLGRHGPAPWEPWVYRALGLPFTFALLVLLLAVTGS